MTTQAFVAEDAIDITPSDTLEIKPKTYGIRANVAGNIRFLGGRGIEHTWFINDGQTIPIEVKKVFATGTTAEGIAVYIR